MEEEEEGVSRPPRTRPRPPPVVPPLVLLAGDVMLEAQDEDVFKRNVGIFVFKSKGTGLPIFK